MPKNKDRYVSGQFLRSISNLKSSASRKLASLRCPEFSEGFGLWVAMRLMDAALEGNLSLELGYLTVSEKKMVIANLPAGVEVAACSKNRTNPKRFDIYLKF